MENEFSKYLPYFTAGGSSLLSGIGSLFGGGYKDPSKSAMPYLNRMPGQLERYFNPYIEAGHRALPGLEREYGSLISNPGGRMNEIGAGYQQSPGFQFALNQALQGAGHAAAAGGMAGSPMHEQQNMDISTNLANRDYNEWLSRALGMYGQGLAGEQGLYNTGAQMGGRLGENLSAIEQQKALLAYLGQAGQNQRRNDIFGGIGGLLGTLTGLPFMGKKDADTAD